MSSAVIKALQLTQLENDLIDIRRKIKKHEGIINSPNTRFKHKEDSKKRLANLARQRDSLINRITEAALL